MNKIYLDCSKEFILPADHGIPRVVRCLSLDKRITPIVLYKNKFYKINKLQSEDVKKKNSSRSIVSLIKKILSLAISYNHTKTLKSFLVKKYYQKRINKKKDLLIPLIFEKGDVLIFPDLLGPQISESILGSLRNKGVRLGFILYDLIVIDHPEFFRKVDDVGYNNYLEICLKNIDFSVAISLTVKNKFENYLYDRKLKMKGDFFYLGTDFADFRKEIKNDYLINIFKKPTYILVSTFEPRKNHGNVLKAFEILWKEGKDINLFFIGKKGWKCESLMKNLESHPELNKRLFFSHNISDQELDFCYRNAKKLITASFDEGFNLPLVEALSRNTQVLVSDIEIHREVGENSCVFFDPNSPKDLAKKIIEDKQIESFKDAKIFTWEQSVDMLISSIKRLV